MGSLFSKKKISRVSEHDKAVLQMKQQRDKLKQYQLRIENKLESERVLAKKLLQNGQKDRAKLLLKKKRFQENLLSRTDGQLENLEKLIHDLEYAQIEMKVVEGLKVGNESLKKLNELLDIDEIERIMDETNEGYEKQMEINNILSGQLSPEDLDDVEREYEQLMGLADGKDVQFPDVPTDDPILTPDETGEKKIEKVGKDKVLVPA